MDTLSLPGLWSLSPIGALIGLLVFLAIALARGWVIPKSSHEREMGQANKRGDEWKETAKGLEAVNVEIRRQNTDLIEASRTASEFFAKVTTNIEDTESRHVGP